MAITVRPATSTDRSATAEVIYYAFHQLDERHDIPAYMNSMEDAEIVASHLYGIPKIYGFVAEDEGQVNFSSSMRTRKSTHLGATGADQDSAARFFVPHGVRQRRL